MSADVLSSLCVFEIRGLVSVKLSPGDVLSSLCVFEIRGVVSVKLYIPQMLCHPSVCLKSGCSECETLMSGDALSSLCVFEITV